MIVTTQLLVYFRFFSINIFTHHIVAQRICVNLYAPSNIITDDIYPHRHSQNCQILSCLLGETYVWGHVDPLRGPIISVGLGVSTPKMSTAIVNKLQEAKLECPVKTQRETS